MNRGKPAADQFSGFASDGRLLFIVRDGDNVTHAGIFGATWLQTPAGQKKGEGFRAGLPLQGMVKQLVILNTSFHLRCSHRGLRQLV